MKRRRYVIEKLINACDAALHERMYKEWPAVADLLMDAMDEGEKELEKMTREDILILAAVVVAVLAISWWAFWG